MGIFDRIRMWESRADRWACGRLSKEEYAEAMVIDRYVKAHPWRVGLGYLCASGVLAAVLVGIKPAMPLWEAWVVAHVLLTSIAIALVGIWFGHRRRKGKPLWRMVVGTLVATAVGATVGFGVGRLLAGKAVLETPPAEVIRVLSISLLIGIVMAALFAGVGWIRSREIRVREEALRAEAERERLERRNREAELKLLQAQLEPHFLFNTLANLRFLVQKGSPDALAMLDHLIDYLRTALPGIRAEASTIGNEAALARAYLEIIRLRMGGDLAFEIDVPEGLASRSCPPLMLMTLVENAVKHGIAPVGRGRVAISASEEGGVMRISVEDDGRGIEGDAKAGVGLANVRERLVAVFGRDASLELSPRPGGGTRAVLAIPEGSR
jgi:signal transduction histidine kinase